MIIPVQKLTLCLLLSNILYYISQCPVPAFGSPIFLAFISPQNHGGSEGREKRHWLIELQLSQKAQTSRKVMGVRFLAHTDPFSKAVSDSCDKA